MSTIPLAGRRLSTVSLALLLGVSACAPVLSPPYRDFEVRALPTAAASGDTTLTARLRASAEAAGWETVPSLSAGVVTTAPRPVGAGALSRTTAALDLVPVDGDPPQFVRVVVRAERRSFLFGRSKVYALDGPLREAVLAPITEALAARGLFALGTPRDRDEDATDD
jgi:hypothetical protein